MSTTIQDVARHAGVSVSTVSNVLNGRADRMRAETLARVEASKRSAQRHVTRRRRPDARRDPRNSALARSPARFSTAR